MLGRRSTRRLRPGESEAQATAFSLVPSGLKLPSNPSLSSNLSTIFGFAMDSWVNCLQIRNVPPFVRKRGEELMPLILAFPIELYTLIMDSLTVTDLKKLILIGSAHLNAILQLKGAVKSLRLVSTCNHSLEQQLKTSLFRSIPTLTKFVVDLMTHFSITPDWKVSILPPTLTHLHVQQRFASPPFVDIAIKDAWPPHPTMNRMFQLNKLLPNISTFTLSKPHLWFDLGQLFPKLEYLAMIGEGSSFQYPEDKLYGGLPELRVLRAPYTLTQMKSFPPHLTSLHCRSISTTLLNAVPPRITHLQLYKMVIPLGNVQTWTWMKDLTCLFIMAPELDNYNKLLPRSLTSLNISDTRARPFQNLPANLTSLTINNFTRNFLHNLQDIDVPLLHLSLTNVIIWEKREWAFFPRSLRSVYLYRILAWDFENMPPLLESITCSSGEFSDYDLAKLPNLTQIQVRTWSLTGILVPSNATVVSVNLLKRTLLSHPNVSDNARIRFIRILALTNLPEACERVENVHISKSITLAQLPRSFISLPKAYSIQDSSAFVLEHLPQSLTKLTVEGPMRLERWLALPSTVTTVRSGIVAFTEEDILSFISHLKDKEADGEPIIAISLPSAILVPALRKLAPNAQKDRFIADVIAKKPKVACWSPDHFALLPDSVTSLTLPYGLATTPTPWVSSNSMEERSSAPSAGSSVPTIEPCKFPLSLTSLKIGEDKWDYSTLTKRRESRRRINSNDALRGSGISLLSLPIRLIRLELFGFVLLQDIQPIAKLSSLQTLALGKIQLDSAFEIATAHAFIAVLPSSLKTLRILEYFDPHKVITRLPPLLTDLELFSLHPHYYEASLFQQLPSQLTRLRLNGNYRCDTKRITELLPASLTDVSLFRRTKP